MQMPVSIKAPTGNPIGRKRLRDYIDLTLAKMKWAVCYALLGMLSGLTIMCILWIHPSPVSNKAALSPVWQPSS